MHHNVPPYSVDQNRVLVEEQQTAESTDKST